MLILKSIMVFLKMIQSYGIAILSEDALYHLDCPEDSLDIVNQWSYHARLYHAASYVARHKEMTFNSIQFLWLWS